MAAEPVSELALEALLDTPGYTCGGADFSQVGGGAPACLPGDCGEVRPGCRRAAEDAAVADVAPHAVSAAHAMHATRPTREQRMLRRRRMLLGWLEIESDVR